jgi:hypothetical protein
VDWRRGQSFDFITSETIMNNAWVASTAQPESACIGVYLLSYLRWKFLGAAGTMAGVWHLYRFQPQIRERGTDAHGFPSTA